MALNPPPIQEKTTDKNGLFPQVWIRWFSKLYTESQSGYSGTFTNGDGDTVTVENGKIIDVS